MFDNIIEGELSELNVDHEHEDYAKQNKVDNLIQKISRD